MHVLGLPVFDWDDNAVSLEAKTNLLIFESFMSIKLLWLILSNLQRS